MVAGRVNRRLEQPRERVLATALEMIAEQGLAALTMASLGARLGTSGGHLLYYFGTKDQLLLATLRWSEDSYTARRDAIVAKATDPVGGFRDYAALYLPAHEADPRWQLWLEVWARTPYDETLAAGQRELEAPWKEALTSVVAPALPGSEVEAWVDRTLAMLDGFCIAMVTGAPMKRRRALALLADHAEGLARSGR